MPESKYDEMVVLAKIVAYKVGNDGNSPSLGHLKMVCNLPTRTTAKRLVAKLEQQGYLDVVDGIIHLKGGRYVVPPQLLAAIPKV